MTSPDPETPAAGPGRPEPVLGAAGVASALTGIAGLVLTLLVTAHVLTPEGSAVLGPALASALPALVGVVGTIAAAYHARARVTPLANPQTSGGTPLIPATVLSRPDGPQTPGVADHAAPDAD